jgi:AGCS family alanine or glycine:cation symporter
LIVGYGPGYARLQIVEIFEDIVSFGMTYVWNYPAEFPWIAGVLLAVGLYVTLRLVFIQLRQIPHAIRVVMGKYDDPADEGDVSHFQALSTALSATVGIGNIAGVAIAIHLGGPGALFWMWMTAFFGMALKFTECTLAVRYRDFDENGEVAGGPMYYIEKGLGRSWKPLAILFALFAIISSFGGGNMNQANTVAQSAVADLGTPLWLVGFALAGIVGAVILGGIQSIARVTSRLAPSMAVLYVTGAMAVLLLNAPDVPAAFATIVRSAFTPEAGLSGAGTGLFIQALAMGVRRGLFSNEAGQGSAPIAHAAARTDEPVREGAVALLEPLIDTLIICTMTGLVIVVTGVWDQKRDGEFDLAGAQVEIASEAHAEAADRGVEIPVNIVGGEVPEELVFTRFDAPVDEARIVIATGAAEFPFSGVLTLARAKGVWTITGAHGVPLESLRVHGKHLRTGSQLTGWAFEVGLSPLGGWGNWVVTICVFLFAVSTMISWSYYGDRCVTYLFGSRYVIVYRLVYVGVVYIGATTALQVVWDYGDLALGLMTVPNLIAVALLTPQVVKMSREYFARMKAEDLPRMKAEEREQEE